MAEAPETITLTLNEAARLLGVSASTAREQAKLRKWPGAFQIGSKWLVHRATFMDGIERMAKGEQVPSSTGDALLERSLDEARFRLHRKRA